MVGLKGSAGHAVVQDDDPRVRLEPAPAVVQPYREAKDVSGGLHGAAAAALPQPECAPARAGGGDMGAGMWGESGAGAALAAAAQGKAWALGVRPLEDAAHPPWPSWHSAPLRRQLAVGRWRAWSALGAGLRAAQWPQLPHFEWPQLQRTRHRPQLALIFGALVAGSTGSVWLIVSREEVQQVSGAELLPARAGPKEPRETTTEVWWASKKAFTLEKGPRGPETLRRGLGMASTTCKSCGRVLRPWAFASTMRNGWR